MRRSVSLALLGLLALPAAAQIIVTGSTLSGTATAEGFTSNDTDAVLVNVSQGGTDALAVLDGQRSGGATSIVLDGNADTQQVLSSEPTSAVGFAVIDFTLTTPSDVTFTFAILAANRAGAGTSNSAVASLTGPGGVLASLSRSNVTATSTQVRTFTALAAGDYRINFDWRADLAVGASVSNAGIDPRVTFAATPVPEPASIAVLALGLAAFRRRRS